jgi:hypothetical protein
MYELELLNALGTGDQVKIKSIILKMLSVNYFFFFITIN